MNPDYRKEKLEGFASLNFHHESINWVKLDQELSCINWEEHLIDKCVDLILETIYENLLLVCKKFIPKKGQIIRKSFIPRDRRILMRNRVNINKALHRAHPRRRNALTKRLELIEFKLLESHKREKHAKEIKSGGCHKS